MPRKKPIAISKPERLTTSFDEIIALIQQARGRG